MELAYVSEEHSKWIPFFEKKIQALPKEAGVLFSSVFWNPAFGGKCSVLNFVLGLRKGMTKDIGEALIQQALKDTPINSIQFLPNVVIYIGNSGAARDQSSEEPHSDSH
jgi:hypothetical protein